MTSFLRCGMRYGASKTPSNSCLSVRAISRRNEEARWGSPTRQFDNPHCQSDLSRIILLPGRDLVWLRLRAILSIGNEEARRGSSVGWFEYLRGHLDRLRTSGGSKIFIVLFWKSL
uniref:Uncharacterized protein n=1 Tax=Odontella aurita TaxID=265563 RepID=A0A7S4HR68_9STRA|mmetsp:Transcript_13970/g.40896  ORF Transcript_13970/g.40896 Transcript_13970/m.40896 type:complete len:116 (+) Transcript_13970:545-892(+)